MNLWFDNEMVRFSPIHMGRIRAPEMRMMARWDWIRLKNSVSIPERSQIEANASHIVRGDEVIISAKCASKRDSCW